LGIDLHQAPIAIRLLYLALAFFKSRGEHERSGPGWITGDLLCRRSASTGAPYSGATHRASPHILETKLAWYKWIGLVRKTRPTYPRTWVRLKSQSGSFPPKRHLGK
jgi:hypothetical protein